MTNVQFIQTRVDILARLINVASTETTRFYLNGVNVRTRRGTPGVICEATNGHIAAIEHDADGAKVVREPSVDESAIVSRETIAAIVREAKDALKRNALSLEDFARIRVRVRPDTFTLILPSGDTTIAVAPFPCKAFVDGTFPDVERVVPRFDPDARAGTADFYNAEYIALLAHSAKQPGKRTRGCMAPFGYVLYSDSLRSDKGIGTPALMRVSDAPHWFGVIMPIRGGEETPAPAWYFGERSAPMAVAAE